MTSGQEKYDCVQWFKEHLTINKKKNKFLENL